MSVKKVMYVIFITNQGPAIEIAVPKGKSVNAKFCKVKVFHRFQKHFKAGRAATGLRGVRLLHDNATSHKAAIVREYLKQEKLDELPRPSYSLKLAPCAFFLLPRLKKYQTRKKIPVRLFFSVQYTSKLMKTHLKL
jgi:hypothetical protein